MSASLLSKLVLSFLKVRKEELKLQRAQALADCEATKLEVKTKDLRWPEISSEPLQPKSWETDNECSNFRLFKTILVAQFQLTKRTVYFLFWPVH